MDIRGQVTDQSSLTDDLERVMRGREKLIESLSRLTVESEGVGLKGWWL